MEHDHAAAANLARRVLADLDAVVERLGARYLDVSEYAALGEEQLRLAVLPMSRRILATFLTDVAARRDPSVATIAELAAETGRRRLAMGVPLEPMLHVYRIAGRVLWEALLSAARRDELEVLGPVGGAWMDYIDEAATIAASAYLEASHESIRHLDERRRQLVQALLAAQDEAEVAAVSTELSTPLAPVYVPVLLAGPTVAARIDAAVAAASAGTLAGPRGAHVLLLVPAPGADLAQVAAAVDAETVAWASQAPPGPPLAAEVAVAESILSAGIAHGRRGIFGPDDLLLDRLLSANHRVADAIQRRVMHALRAADPHGTLTETLRAYVSSGSVPATARRTRVHQNTILYRLRKVAEVTGHDPRVPAQAAVLVLALAHDPLGNPPLTAARN